MTGFVGVGGYYPEMGFECALLERVQKCLSRVEFHARAYAASERDAIWASI